MGAGVKFDDTKTAENCFLTRTDLDAVSTEHPIYISHRGGHVYFVNGKAFERVGITRDTTDPPGGAYQRHPQTGELTGVLFERAAEPFSADLPPITAGDRRAGLKHICQMFNAAGLTSVHDAIVSSQDLQTYQVASASRGLGSLNPDSTGEGLVPGELTLRV
jgi:hypothetical protein